MTTEQMKEINATIDTLRGKGFSVRVNLPQISIEAADGREWNADVSNVSLKISEILELEKTYAPFKPSRRNRK